MDSEEALATAFANLKGPRNKDVMATAAALASLKALPGFGSNAAVGSAVGVSGEIVREFLSLLQLPAPVQKLLAEQRIGLEQGRRLWQLARARPDIVVEAADAMADLSAMDSRHLAEYLVKHPGLPVLEAKRLLLAGKTVTTREFHVVARLGEEDFRSLRRHARQKGVSVDQLVAEIVTGWVEGFERSG